MDRLRKPLSGLGLPLAGALLIAALAAGGAQAQTINPDNTTITGVAVNPTLNYGSQVVTCATGTAVGTTGTDSDVVDVELQFQGPCDISGLIDFVPTCSKASGPQSELGTARLRVLTSDTNLGEVDRLNEGFFCEFTAPGLCTIRFGPQELPVRSGWVNSANLLNEGSNGDELIDADVDVLATNDNTLCGPVPGAGMGIQGDYDLDTAVTFDP